MSEYAVTVFLICVIAGVLGSISYGSGKAEKIALGIIVLGVVISLPIDSGFDLDGWLGSADTEMPPGSEYGQVIEEAYAEGIARAVADRFSLQREDIYLRIDGFNVEDMSADRVRIVLSGRAIIADPDGIKNYVSEIIKGECSVEIKLG